MITQDERALPELRQAVLDPVTLEHYFLDLEQLTDVLAITGKAGAMTYSSEQGLTLREAREMLASRALRGAQVRYRYQGEIWWDTLLAGAQGIRITRMRLSDAMNA